MNELQIEKRQLESQVADLKLVLEGGPDAELESSLATAEVRMAEIDGELLKAKPPVPVQTRAMNPSPKADLLASWLRAGTPVEQRGDQQAVSRSGGSGTMLTIRSADGVKSNVAPGSYLVPRKFIDEVFHEIELTCPLLDFSHVMRTDGGNPLDIPIDVDGISAEGHWLDQLVEDDLLDPSQNQATFQAYACTSHVILAAWSLLQDSSVAENLFARQIGNRIGKALEKAFLVGDGVGKPTGILNGAGTATGLPIHTSATSGKIDTDDLLAALAKVDPSMLSGNKVRMLVNPTELYKLRSLKDGQQRYLISDPVNGFFPTVLGIPTQPSLHIPAGQIVIANFDSFFVRIAREIELVKLIEKYATRRATGFFAWCRADSKLVSTRGGIIVKAKA